MYFDPDRYLCYLLVVILCSDVDSDSTNPLVPTMEMVRAQFMIPDENATSPQDARFVLFQTFILSLLGEPKLRKRTVTHNFARENVETFVSFEFPFENDPYSIFPCRNYWKIFVFLLLIINPFDIRISFVLLYSTYLAICLFTEGSWIIGF